MADELSDVAVGLTVAGGPQDQPTPTPVTTATPADPSFPGGQPQPDPVITQDDDFVFKAKAPEPPAGGAGGDDPFVTKFGMDEATLRAKIKENEEYVSKLKEYETKTPESTYKSKIGEIFDNLIAKGYKDEDAPKLVEMILTDPSKLDDKQAILFSMKEKYPFLNDSQLNAKYNQLYNTENPDLTDDQRSVVEADRKIASEEARQQISKLKENYMAGKEDQSAIRSQQAETERTEAWKGKSAEIVKGFDKIEVDLGDATWSWKIPAEAKEKLTEALYRMSVFGGIGTDEQGVEQAKAALRNHVLAQYQADILKAYGARVRSMSDEQWTQLLHNPSIKGGTQTMEFNATKDRDTLIYEQIAKHEGLI